MQDIEYISLLKNDLYTTFKGTWKGKPAIIKFFHERSDPNNEYDFLEFWKVSFPNDRILRIPQLYCRITLDNEDITITLEREIYMGNVYQVIVYEYIEGEVINTKNIDKVKLATDIREQLLEIHRLGFVYADLGVSNILYTEGRYVLIDFGRVFSLEDPKFPPMQYMIDDEDVPTQEDDLSRLEEICLHIE